MKIGQTQLEQNQIDKARELYDKGMSITNLHIRFGVSHQTMSNIVKRKGSYSNR